jgi:hypothetical protein
MDLGAALVGMFTVGVIKLAVMALTARLLYLLRRALRGAPSGGGARRFSLVARDAPREMGWLFASLALFAVSELACAAEIWILARSSPILGILHSVSSAAGMGLFALALYAYADREILSFTGRACAGHRVCRGCPVREGLTCRYAGLLQLAAAFVACAAVPPLLSSTAPMAGDPRRYALPFAAWNAWYDDTARPLLARLGHDAAGASFDLSAAVQITDYRVLPALSALLAGVALVHLRLRREARGVLVLAFAGGALAYPYCELVLNRATGDVIFGSLAHEIAELGFILFTGHLLERTFTPRGAAA